MVGSDLDNTPALASPSAKAKGKQPVYEEVRGRSRFRDHWPQYDSPYLGSQHNYSSNEAASSTATAPPSATPSGSSTWRPVAPPVETVGVLLAEIANCLSDTILALRISDQRHWGTDEIDQVQRLEETLDEAAKDFQELSPLVNGQFYYENDKNPFSLAELSRLSDLFQAHRTTFHEWLRGGGPINPMWANETTHLRKALHRAQCRAARRIFSSLREESHRCLGAHLVQRALPDRIRTGHTRSSLASVPERASLSSIPDNSSRSSTAGSMTALNSIRGSVADNESEQVAACNGVGKFERFGDRDIAFVCDFCDGYIVWEDLTTLPASRTWQKDPQEQAREHKRRSRDRDSLMMRKGNRGPRELILPQYHAQHHSQHHSQYHSQHHHHSQQLVNMEAGNRGSVAASEPGTRSSIVSDAPTVASSGSAVTLHGSGADDGQSEYNWMATGVSVSSVEDGDQVPTEKTIIFAPVAIANHVPPEEGEWQARLLCPYCDDWIVYDQGDGEMEAVRYAQDEHGFESLEKLREHLAWYHVPGYLESVAKPVTSVASKATGSGTCVVM